MRLLNISHVYLTRVVSSNELYLNYLTLQGKLLYTVTNTLLVQTQKPDAILLKDVAHWQEAGYFIKNGEKGIQILEPGKEYKKRDGSYGCSYNPKYVFDVAQTDAQEEKKEVDYKSVISAIVYKEKIKPQIVSEDSTLPRPVYYDVVSDAMYVLKGQEMNEMISGLIREYIFIEVKNQYSSYEEAKFCVLSITQMICSRYGIENKNESIDCVNHFNGMDDKVIKSELHDMKRIFDSVNQRMEHGLYMKGKNNYRGHEER